MSLCDNCGTRSERACTYTAMTREYYRVLIKPLRHVAYRYGYALAVHGSIKTDIDLLAAPWRDSAVPAESLAEAIRATAEAIIGVCVIRECDKDRLPEKKPCGRLAWAFYLGPDAVYRQVPYIDLSVMPKEYKAKKE